MNTNILRKSVVSLVIAAVLVGCTNQHGDITKQSVFGVGGAVTGAIAGSMIGKGSGAVVGALAGAALGGLVGSTVGKSLDESDLRRHAETQNRAFEYNKSGVRSSWRNPDTSAYGEITPLGTYHRNGRYCREYTQTIKVGGKSETGYGTACRQEDGSWEIVK